MDLNKLFELARGGDLTAMEELAQRFFWGVDVEENDDQAFYWFVNAARKGSAIGYNGLGNCYRIGAGVEANAVKAFEICACSGVSRVDFLIVNDIPYILEINTNPGMTDTSDLPAQAAACGIDYDNLVEMILKSVGLNK